MTWLKPLFVCGVGAWCALACVAHAQTIYAFDKDEAAWNRVPQTWKGSPTFTGTRSNVTCTVDVIEVAQSGPGKPFVLSVIAQAGKYQSFRATVRVLGKEGAEIFHDTVTFVRSKEGKERLSASTRSGAPVGMDGALRLRLGSCTPSRSDGQL